MALFDKKTTETNIPELQEYYANQKRESTGLAWLLAFGSLLITAALVIGLFVGGRWAYRKITNKNKTTTVSVVDTSSNEPASTPAATTPAATTPATTPAATTPAASTTTPAQGVSTTQSTTTNTSAVAATTTTATQVPNTGPGNTIGLFVFVSAIAYFAHLKRTARKLNR